MTIWTWQKSSIEGAREPLRATPPSGDAFMARLTCLSFYSHFKRKFYIENKEMKMKHKKLRADHIGKSRLGSGLKISKL